MELEPILLQILDQGISTDRPIDPVTHASICTVNINEQTADHYIQATMAYTTVTVTYLHYTLCKIIWVDDGCHFRVYHDKGQALMVMIACVLNTVNEGNTLWQ
jgi:hypothetical protein